MPLDPKPDFSSDDSYSFITLRWHATTHWVSHIEREGRVAAYRPRPAVTVLVPINAFDRGLADGPVPWALRVSFRPVGSISCQHRGSVAATTVRAGLVDAPSPWPPSTAMIVFGGGPMSGDSVRVAAVGDLHMGASGAGRFRRHFERAGRESDVLLLAGDLTRRGTPAEAKCVAGEIVGLDIPVVVVLGNHDHLSDAGDQVAATLRAAGANVLEDSGVVLQIGGLRVGIGGGMAGGGGFDDTSSAVGWSPSAVSQALRGLSCDVRVALTHYAPTVTTLRGEPPRLLPRLGAAALGQVIDAAGVTLAVHGHAHHGVEVGATPSGVPVRNVAYPVIRQEFRVYTVRRDGQVVTGPASMAGRARWAIARAKAVPAFGVARLRAATPHRLGAGRGRQ